MSDIIDEIDALVDDQMAGGEARQGYDFGDPTFPRCPHCDRHWHGLAITERIGAMYSNGWFDEEYRAAEDDSRVLCRGSDFIGPMPAEFRLGFTNSGAGSISIAPVRRPRWIEQLMEVAEQFCLDVALNIMCLPPMHHTRVVFVTADGETIIGTISDAHHQGTSTLTISPVERSVRILQSVQEWTEVLAGRPENRLLPMRLEDV